MKIRIVSGLLVAALVLSGCDEETVDEGPPPVRAIKYSTLDARAGFQLRQIAGIVAADVTSNVAFETSGQVIEMMREVGDRVSKGDLLARLDPEPLKLAVDRAKGELERALGTVEDARSKFQQQKQLLERGFATRTAFDTAQANLKNAEGAVSVARSTLNQAERDLSRAELKAPFDGVIARRSVEVFEEVTGGQAIYSMQTEDRGKIEASLPETLINRVSLGTEVSVTFPPLGDATTAGTVTEIAPLAGDANAYPIKVSLENTPSGTRPGMSAELTFRFAIEETGEAFVVPLAAVQPTTADDAEGVMYIYDPDTRTVGKRKVTISNIEGNSLVVVGDLKEGEIIATAGVSFLHDGMRVDLFNPKTLR